VKIGFSDVIQRRLGSAVINHESAPALRVIRTLLWVLPPPRGRSVLCFGLRRPTGFESLQNNLRRTHEILLALPKMRTLLLGRLDPRIASRDVFRVTSEPGTKGDSAMTTANAVLQNGLTNTILHGNCIETMQRIPANSIDFIITDPPYLVNYRDRTGRSIQNDANADWLKPAMREAYRVLKQNRVAVMFYGWTRVDEFFEAWRSAGFQPVGHVVFQKRYSSKSRFLRYQHEQAYLLAKGRPPVPAQPLADVMDMPYSGNKLHPTQKPVAVLAPLVRSFSLPGELVLDPFAGSGSSCAAALLAGRRYLGIELDETYYREATARIARVQKRIADKRSSPSSIPTKVA
jgi:DNA modification methylase